MNQLAVKLIAVIAVIIIIVAAVAVYFSGDDDDDDKGYNIKGALPVMGNADEDYDIDNDDLDIIKNIIAGKEGYTLANYPYADANNDGKVTSDDETIVQHVINHEKTDVYIINTNFDATTYINSIHWPCTYMISAGVSTLPMLYKSAGVIDRVVGMALSSPWNEDPYLYPELKDFESLGPNMREFDVEKVRDVVKQKGADCIVCVASLKANESIFEDDMGLSIIRPACADPTVEGYTSAMLLMGFIFDTPTQSLQVSEWFQNLKEEIDSKTKDLTQTRAIVIGNIRSTSVYAPTSQYAQVVVQADGTFPSEVINQTSSIAFGDWVYDMKDCDVAIDFHSGSSDNSWYSPDCDVSEYVSGIKTCSDTTMYKNDRAYVIAFDLPMPIKIAYCAVALYPDTFSESWAQEKAQTYFDSFFGGIIDMSKLNVFLTTDEIDKL